MQKVTDWTCTRDDVTRTRLAEIHTPNGPTLELSTGSHDGIEIYHDSATRWFYVISWATSPITTIGLYVYALDGEPISDQSRFFQDHAAQRLIDSLPDDQRWAQRPDYNARQAARALLGDEVSHAA